MGGGGAAGVGAHVAKRAEPRPRLSATRPTCGICVCRGCGEADEVQRAVDDGVCDERPAGSGAGRVRERCAQHRAQDAPQRLRKERVGQRAVARAQRREARQRRRVAPLRLPHHLVRAGPRTHSARAAAAYTYRRAARGRVRGARGWGPRAPCGLGAMRMARLPRAARGAARSRPAASGPAGGTSRSRAGCRHSASSPRG